MSMIFKYDPISDTLYIDTCPPYAEQDSDEISPGVLARTNPATGRIETIEVMHFKRRFAAGEPVELPLNIEMQPAVPR